jgi:hypothetical protein
LNEALHTEALNERIFCLQTALRKEIIDLCGRSSGSYELEPANLSDDS